MEVVRTTFLLTVFMLDNFMVSAAKCKPRPVLLEQKHAMTPKYVKVYRCHGEDDDYTKHDKCVYIKQNNIKVNIKINNVDEEVRTFINHTKCGMACACEWIENEYRNCTGEIYEVDCYPGLTWNPDKCECVCSSTSPSIQTGGATKDRKNGGHSVPIIVFIVSLLGEFAVVVGISYCVFHKRRRNPDGEVPVFDRQCSTNSMQQLSNVIKRQCSRPRDGHVEGSVSLLDNKNPEDDDSFSGSDITHMEINIRK